MYEIVKINDTERNAKALYKTLGHMYPKPKEGGYEVVITLACDIFGKLSLLGIDSEFEGSAHWFGAVLDFMKHQGHTMSIGEVCKIEVRVDIVDYIIDTFHEDIMKSELTDAEKAHRIEQTTYKKFVFAEISRDSHQYQT